MTRLKLMFSHRSVQALFALWIIGWAMVIYAGAYNLLWLVPLGIVGQMLNEYSLHRHIFHLPPPKSQFWFDVLYQAHYGHHDFPNNQPLFFVPIWIAIPIGLFGFFITYLVLGFFSVAEPLAGAGAFTFIGGGTTFLFYEWFHMTAHWNFKKGNGKKNAVEKYVTKLHGQHHYRDFSRWFHVSPGGEIIDRAMGTAIDRETLKNQARVEHLTTLGLKPDDPRLLSARARFATKYGLQLDEVSRAARA